MRTSVHPHPGEKGVATEAAVLGVATSLSTTVRVLRTKDCGPAR